LRRAGVALRRIVTRLIDSWKQAGTAPDAPVLIWSYGDALLVETKQRCNRRLPERTAEREFSYSSVGRTQGQSPKGFTVDHNQVKLGCGAEAFERAKVAIVAWKMFDMPWVNLCWPGAAIEPGSTVAILIAHFGFWSLNASRIVYVVDEDGPAKQFGFAYGTLPGHEELGEERFLVRFDPADQSVWYDIFAFSRPGKWARFAKPLARVLQRRFVRESKVAMVRAVEEFSSPKAK